jgi:hypothetical protein
VCEVRGQGHNNSVSSLYLQQSKSRWAHTQTDRSPRHDTNHSTYSYEHGFPSPCAAGTLLYRLARRRHVQRQPSLVFRCSKKHALQHTLNSPPHMHAQPHVSLSRSDISNPLNPRPTTNGLLKKVEVEEGVWERDFLYCRRFEFFCHIHTA